MNARVKKDSKQNNNIYQIEYIISDISQSSRIGFLFGYEIITRKNTDKQFGFGKLLFDKLFVFRQLEVLVRVFHLTVFSNLTRFICPAI